MITSFCENFVLDAWRIASPTLPKTSNRPKCFCRMNAANTSVELAPMPRFCFELGILNPKRMARAGRRSLSRQMRILVASEKRSEEHTSELQSRGHLVCRLLLEKKKKKRK